jgi:phosphoribosylamine-glycine ligase
MKTDMDGYLVKELSKLRPYLRAASYLGCIDINTIIGEDDKQPYFLEFTPRWGYSAMYCLVALMPEGSLGNFFLNGFKFIPKAEYACSQLISIPPYPYMEPKDLSKMAKDVGIGNTLGQLKNMYLQDIYQDENGDLRCAGADGNIGVMTATGDSLEDTTKQMYKNIDKLKIYSDYQYRTDHMASHTKRLKDLKALGINVS